MKIPDYKSTLLVAALFTATAFTARAATCTVPSATYPTIQSAINDSGCDPINVAPGVYDENLLIQRPLTLNGAQAAQPVAGRTSGGPAESVLRGANPTGSVPVIIIDAAGVAVDGFTISNSVVANAATGIDIKPFLDASIRNNIIDGIVTSETGSSGTAQAIFLESGIELTDIGNNVIQNIAGNQAAHAILLGDGAVPNHSEAVYIHDNRITGVTSTDGGAYGVLVRTPAGTTGFNFRFNDVSNLEGGTLVHAVSFVGDMEFTLVMFNTFTNLVGPSTDNVAVSFADDPNVFRSSVTDNNFNLTISSYGIRIPDGLTSTTGPMAGACNFWGNPDGPGPVGPGHGARVSPGILYTPWQVAPIPSPELADVFCTGNNTPTSEAQCKDGGWTRTVHRDGTPFKNQGDCMQYVNNGH
jgi:hypothetical protein